MGLIDMYKLKEIGRKDIEEINKWRMDFEVVKESGSNFRYISYEVDEAWYEAYLKRRDTVIECVIVDETDRVLGRISLRDIDYINSKAELGIVVGESGNQNKGIGNWALNEMLRHAFMNMNLNRVYLSTPENNMRARHLYEKNGFVLEGILRQHHFFDGKYRNYCIYGIIKDQYKNNVGEGDKNGIENSRGE